MNLEQSFSENVRTLREEFDLSFSRPRTGEGEERRDFVTIRIEGALFAIAIDQLSGLELGRRVVSIPGIRGHCLGVAGVRGAVVPVISLARVLGYGLNEEGDGTRLWLALVGAQNPVAFAFSEFAGHFRIPVSDVFVAQSSTPGRPRESFRLNGSTGLVLSAEFLLEQGVSNGG